MVPESWERHISQVESDEFGEYLVRELTIYCPYCATQLAHDGIWELTDYNVEMPPARTPSEPTGYAATAYEVSEPNTP